MHGAIVGQDMVELYIAIVSLMDVGDNFIPQQAGFHNVAFFSGMHFFAAFFRELEGHTGNALNFISVINLRIDRAFLAVFQVDDLFGFTKIHTARELAHNEDIEALDQLLLEAGAFCQSRIANGGTQIGKQAEIFAQAQQASFWAGVIGHSIPLWSANRAKNHRISFFCQLHGGV